MYCKYYALYRNWNGCRCVQRSTCQISLLSFKNLSAAMPQSPNSSTHIAPLHISFYPISLPSETPASSLCVFQYLAHSPVTIRELVALHFASWFKREKKRKLRSFIYLSLLRCFCLDVGYFFCSVLFSIFVVLHCESKEFRQKYYLL